jgi:hypothetical protein
VIPKPKGKAGDKKHGFNLQEAMKLGDDVQKELYDAIQVRHGRIQAWPSCTSQLLHFCSQRSVRTNSIRAGLDFAADYRRQDPAKLANVFKMVGIGLGICPSRSTYPHWCACADTQGPSLHDEEALSS